MRATNGLDAFAGVDRRLELNMRERPIAPVRIYQIKVTLNGTRPAVWRRFLVRGDVLLAKLHDIVQRVMGWQDSHLHHFIIRGKRYARHEEDESERMLDESDHRLSDVIAGGQFEYLYDFGDNWEHTLEIENVGAPKAKIRYPVCLDGARACPPEDVGGFCGYETFLEAIKDPKHPEHDDYQAWIGGSFHSEAFDVARINGRLRSFQR